MTLYVCESCGLSIITSGEDERTPTCDNCGYPTMKVDKEDIDETYR